MIGPKRPHCVQIRTAADARQVAALELWAHGRGDAASIGLARFDALRRSLAIQSQEPFEARAAAVRRTERPGHADSPTCFAASIDAQWLGPAPLAAPDLEDEIGWHLARLTVIDEGAATFALDGDVVMASIDARLRGATVHIRVGAEVYNEDAMPYGMDALLCADEGVVLDFIALAGIAWRGRTRADRAGASGISSAAPASATLRAARAFGAQARRDEARDSLRAFLDARA